MAANPKIFNPNKEPYLTTYNVTNMNIHKRFRDPVGQIVELGEKDEILKRFCSGFNINGGNYFLTAGHCITSAYGMPVCFSDDKRSPIPNGRCAVSFGYEAPEIEFDGRMFDVCVPEHVFKIDETVAHGYCAPTQIDYGILKLAPGAEKWGSLKFANYSPSINHPIVVLHHPARLPKRCSIGEVTTYTDDYAGFIHSAATHGGSSGAPVLSDKDGVVVGIHVAGNEETQKTNVAVFTGTIESTAKTNGHFNFFRSPTPPPLKNESKRSFRLVGFTN